MKNQSKIVKKSSLGVCWSGWGPSWGVLGAWIPSLGCLGAVLEPSLERLGASWRCFGGVLGPNLGSEIEPR